MSNHAKNSSDGFTLVEVVVALAILTVSLVVLLRVFSAGLDRLRVNQSESVASLLLQSLISGVGKTVALQAGVEEGDFPQKYHWRIEIVPYDDNEKSSPVSAYSVVATVVWQEAQNQK